MLVHIGCTSLVHCRATLDIQRQPDASIVTPELVNRLQDEEL
jgi:hypothetical protein